MKKYNISTNLTKVIKNLYNKALLPSSSTAAQETGSEQQLESDRDVYSHPPFFNIFLERIMTGALEDHEDTVSIGGRTITDLRFADEIDGLAGEEEELANLVERLDKASTAYGMEISAKKTKLITNNTSGINTEIKVNGQKAVTGFKYLGSVISDEGSKPEILSRIAQTTAALTRQKPVFIDKSISLSSKIPLMRSLVTSIFLYACES